MKERRVGTFTMGLALIAIGILTLAGIFWKELDLVWVLRLSPAILIFLGIEILVFSFHNSEKLKYDGLSILFAILLIGGTLIGSVVVQVYGNFSTRADLIYDARAEHSRELAGALEGVPEIVSYEARLNASGEFFLYREAPLGERVTYRVRLTDSADEAQFLAKAKPVLQALEKAGFREGTLSVRGDNAEDDTISFSVQLPSGFGLTDEALLKLID